MGHGFVPHIDTRTRSSQDWTTHGVRQYTTEEARSYLGVRLRLTSQRPPRQSWRPASLVSCGSCSDSALTALLRVRCPRWHPVTCTLEMLVGWPTPLGATSRVGYDRASTCAAQRCCVFALQMLEDRSDCRSNLSREEWRYGVANLDVLLGPPAVKQVVVRECLEPCHLSHGETSALAWVWVDEVVTVLGDMASDGWSTGDYGLAPGTGP